MRTYFGHDVRIHRVPDHSGAHKTRQDVHARNGCISVHEAKEIGLSNDEPSIIIVGLQNSELESGKDAYDHYLGFE